LNSLFDFSDVFLCMDFAPSGLNVLGGYVLHGAAPRAVDFALSGLIPANTIHPL